MKYPFHPFGFFVSCPFRPFVPWGQRDMGTRARKARLRARVNV
jgi:hypothetical protein